MVIVTWIKSESWDWCALETVTLWRIFCTGVYLVWYEGTPGRVVCMGQGVIATELDRIRRDETLMRFKSNGRLLVTWAAVSPLRIDGVERYLRDTWPPLVESACRDADVKPIEVNSPAWLRAFL